MNNLAMGEIMTSHDPATHFCVKVNGNCMEGALIKDGALAIFHAQDCAEPGQIVAAKVNGVAVCKRYCKDADGNVYLVTASPNHLPVIVDKAADFRILGVLVEARNPYADGGLVKTS